MSEIATQQALMPELLTVEEFAQRFRVGRSTVFAWISRRIMVQGVHYIKINKTIRIPWSMTLLTSLSAEIEDSEKEPPRSGKGRVSINMDY